MNSVDQQLVQSAPPHLRSQSSSSGDSGVGSLGKPVSPAHQLLLNWPIARRLVLGFLTAAIIAAAISSITGIERANTLQNQADFYRDLVNSNAQLTKSDGFLQLMNTSLNEVLATAAQSGVAAASQSQTIPNIQKLASSYDSILTSYAQHNLISENPNQLALINEAGSQDLITRQNTLASSTLQTWHTYRDAQNSIISDIENGNLPAAQQFNANLATPTHNDALSALNALIQSEGDLANSVLAIESIDERNQLITTLVSALIAFLAVGIVGWFISGTIVPRLQNLRNVVQSVEDGQFDSRIFVQGKDEIAQVAASVNTMLNTIVGLLAEARLQRDALTSAADSLFSDMRVVGAGDLRVNAAVSNDPVGMLANAFNLTVGRFRRLVLRTRTSIQQIDVVFQQEIKHAESSIAVAKRALSSSDLEPTEGARGHHAASQQTLNRLHQVHNLMQTAASQGTEAATNSVLAQIQLAYHITQQLETRSLPEVPKIQQVLLKAGQEMHTLHTNLANALSLITTIEGEMAMGESGGSLDKRSNLLSSSATSVSKQELARLYLEFAQEIIAATSKLRSIMQEMQVSFTTFQVEVP
jgi:HAMP domain-containing protein